MTKTTGPHGSDGFPDPRTRPTMTVEEAGRWLGLSRSSVYDAAASGELPTIRIGRRLMVPTAALAQMLALVPTGGEAA